MIAPDPVLFTVFGIDIMWYGALIGTGFLLAIAISYYRAPKFGIDRDFILTLTIWIIPSALIGARLYYVIFSWDNYSDDLSKILDVRNGGLAVHGGLILSFIVGYFLCKKMCIRDSVCGGGVSASYYRYNLIFIKHAVTCGAVVDSSSHQFLFTFYAQLSR